MFSNREVGFVENVWKRVVAYLRSLAERTEGKIETRKGFFVQKKRNKSIVQIGVQKEALIENIKNILKPTITDRKKP